MNELLTNLANFEQSSDMTTNLTITDVYKYDLYIEGVITITGDENADAEILKQMHLIADTFDNVTVMGSWKWEKTNDGNYNYIFTIGIELE